MNSQFNLPPKSQKLLLMPTFSPNSLLSNSPQHISPLQSNRNLLAKYREQHMSKIKNQISLIFQKQFKEREKKNKSGDYTRANITPLQRSTSLKSKRYASERQKQRREVLLNQSNQKSNYYAILRSNLISSPKKLELKDRKQNFNVKFNKYDLPQIMHRNATKPCFIKGNYREFDLQPWGDNNEDHSYLQ